MSDAATRRRKKRIITSTESLNNIRIRDGSTVVSNIPFSVTSSVKEQQRGMKKWSIPDSDLKRSPIEIALLERLVWIKYREKYWWPVILYKNYREVVKQKEVWRQVPSWKRMQLSHLMVFDSESPRNQVRVARLLGRPNVELVEIKSFVEFYWLLPQVIREMPFKGEVFRSDLELYYDWHLAMDQAESILKECMGTKFALGSPGSKTTWVERAKDAERRQWAAAASCSHFKMLCIPLPDACTSPISIMKNVNTEEEDRDAVSRVAVKL